MIKVREYYDPEPVMIKEGDDISKLGPLFLPPLNIRDHFFQTQEEADEFLAKQKEKRHRRP